MGNLGSSRNGVESATEFAFLADAWLRFLSHALREKNATLNQYWTLLITLERSGITIADMVSLLELNYTTIAECVGRLEVQGALTKTINENDHRCSVLRITSAGQQLFNELDKRLTQTVRKALDPLLGFQRIETMRMFHSLCSRVGKTRMMGNLVRGDSAFTITCAQTSMNFNSLCLNHGITPFQGHLILFVGQRDDTAVKYIRKRLLQDASTLSRTLNKLTQLEYIARTPGDNKREIKVILTPKGLSCASLLAEETTLLMKRLFAEDFLSDIYYQAIDALRTSLTIYEPK